MSNPQSSPVLLVDDDAELTRLVAKFLTSNGFQVDTEADGARALERIAREQPTLVILDVMLPGTDGLTICRSVRSSYAGPIMILTALGDDVDEVAGLETGADDYLAKPVRPRVLLARVRALLRRCKEDATEESHRIGRVPAKSDVWKEGARSIRVGDLELTAGSRAAFLRGQAVFLTSAEFELLWLLARHAGHVLSRDVMHWHTRGLAHDGQDRTIDLRISKLRKKLGDDPRDPALIKSVRGVGYILMQ